MISVMNLLYSGVLIYMKTEIKNCENCDIEFNARVYDLKKGRGKFCSLSCRNKIRTRTIFDRLWDKVNIGAKNDCWEYKEYRNEDGYGVMSYVGKSNILAHRVAYMFKTGTIPEGLRVLHSCDNPPCCNPNHLSVGTQADNVKDMHDKGRANKCKGEQSVKSKLKNEDVLYIRRVFNGTNRKELAEMFNINTNNIMWIVQGKTWKHLL